jgi:hypothetical protein
MDGYLMVTTGQRFLRITDVDIWRSLKCFTAVT